MPSENKRIGIDIDETIAATFEAVLNYTKSKYPSIAHCNFDSLTNHDWWLIPEFDSIAQKDIMEAFRDYNRFDALHAGISPVDNSMRGIDFLKKQGYSLFAITGRDEKNSYNATIHWLDRHFPGIFEQVVFTNHNTEGANRRNKSEVCRELGIKMMIEDNLDFALELAENNIKSYVLTRPWNRHRTESHNNIMKVNNWQEIITDFQLKYV